MAKQTFTVQLTGEAVVELDDAVITVVDDEWRAALYDLHGADEIAKHVAYNLIVNNLKLSQMDGWADQPDDNARVVTVAWEVDAANVF